ncbi:hypothetical protein ACJX0J_027768 [Zea mays]
MHDIEQHSEQIYSTKMSFQEDYNNRKGDEPVGVLHWHDTVDENSTVKCPPFHFKKNIVDYFSFLQFFYIQTLATITRKRLKTLGKPHRNTHIHNDCTITRAPHDNMLKEEKSPAEADELSLEKDGWSKTNRYMSHRIETRINTTKKIPRIESASSPKIESLLDDMTLKNAGPHDYKIHSITTLHIKNKPKFHSQHFQLREALGKIIPVAGQLLGMYSEAGTNAKTISFHEGTTISFSE